MSTPQFDFKLSPMINVEDVRVKFGKPILVRHNGDLEELKNDLSLDQAIAAIKTDHNLLEKSFVKSFESGEEDIPEEDGIIIDTHMGTSHNPNIILVQTGVFLYKGEGFNYTNELIGNIIYDLYNYGKFDKIFSQIQQQILNKTTIKLK